MNWNLLAPVFVPQKHNNLSENESNAFQSQQIASPVDDKFSYQYFSESENHNIFHDSNYDYAEDNDIDGQPATSSNITKKSIAASIFTEKYILPRKEYFRTFRHNLLRSLNRDLSTFNINNCLNNIIDDTNLTFTEKRYFMGKISTLITEKAKTSSEKIDAFEVIRNLIYNKNIYIRINKFLAEILKVGTISELQFVELMHAIIEMERYDIASTDLVVFLLNKSSLNLEILNDLMSFSIKKLKENRVKNPKKFLELLEIIFGEFKINGNYTPESLKNFILNDLELYYMNCNITKTLYISSKFTNENTPEHERISFAENLFLTCIEFDKNFAQTEFLNKYMYFIKDSLIVSSIDNNPILKNNFYFAELAKVKSEDSEFSLKVYTVR